MDPEPIRAYERLKTRLKARVVDTLSADASNAGSLQTQREAVKAEMRSALQGLLLEEPRSGGLSTADQERLIEETAHELIGYGPLDALFADPSVTEIMVNGPHEIFVERDGRLHPAETTFRDTHHLFSVIERMLSSVGASVNESTPICDARLPDGSRMNVIVPPLVLNGPVVTIRKKLQEWTMADYVRIGALSEEAAQFLEACVRARVNLILSGGTSTGKTTLVTILSAFMPTEERIITIENVSELDLAGKRHWIRLVGRAPNLEGRGEVPLRVLVRNALRMRPDRIILGEARGGEALDVVQAMHSGHDGFVTVLHANSSHSALERLQTMMLMSGLDVAPSACRAQIANSVELIVQMGRFVDGSRRLASITQVLGATSEGFALEDVFAFRVEGFSPEGRLEGRCEYTGVAPRCLQKFRMNNIPLPPWMKT